MSIKYLKNSGFTLTELMVVIVILCCLATWVPMAWLSPDKPKDLKAIEHLRAHVYLHQAYFSMFQDYPNTSTGSEEHNAYVRLILSKNPAIATIIRDDTGGGLSDVLLAEAQNNNLNQVTLRTAPASAELRGVTSIWGPIFGFPENCSKNSPLREVTEGTIGPFCNQLETVNFVYRTILVGSHEPAMLTSVNSSDVMIPHRCLGVFGATGAIYIYHIAGGETLSNAHIPSSVVVKLETFNQANELLIAALQACQDGNQTIQDLLPGDHPYKTEAISLIPGI